MDPELTQNGGVAATDPGTQGGGAPPAAPATPPPAPANDPHPGGEGAGAAGGAANTPAAAALGVRDQLRQMGLDFGPAAADDGAALRQLAQAYQQLPQLRQMAQYGEQLMPHLGEFQRFLQLRQQQAQQAQTQQPNWWKKPEYDPAWMSQLTRDPATGEIRAIQGADPSIVQKFHAWNQHRQQFLDRFSQDPIEAIKPGIEGMIQPLLQQYIGQAMQQERERQQAQSLVQQNASWLHVTDANGQPQRDAAGNKVLSQWGQRYGGYIQQAQAMGIMATQGQHEYAMGFVERDFLAAQARAAAQPAAAAQTGAAAKNTFLDAARHQPNVGGHLAQGVNGAPAAPPQMRTARDLQDVMSRRLTAAGINPNAIDNSR